MLKLYIKSEDLKYKSQPPSGGCVLKPHNDLRSKKMSQPAAFGRLCVETLQNAAGFLMHQPAAFGRLCVETFSTS